MLRNSVAPPAEGGGTSIARRRLAAGGTSTNDESVCQNASPSPSPPIGLPPSRMFEITEISGGTSRRRPDVWVSTPYCFWIRRGWIEFEFAELAGEFHVLVVAQRLLAEAQHQMVEPGGADPVADGGSERLAQIDAADLGAAAGLERDNLDIHRHYSAASSASTP